MQLPTHLTAGILVQALVGVVIPDYNLIYFVLVIVLVFLSHLKHVEPPPITQNYYNQKVFRH